MYLNGYYIQFVDSWDKQTKGEIKTSADAKYIRPKAENEIRVTHKIKGIVNHQGTAEELQEMFANPHYNIAVISDCDVPEYDGVYNLDKGNIIRDGGLATWGVELWLSNKNNSIRYSQYQEDYATDYEYFQSETDDYTALENYSGSGTNDASNGFYSTDVRFGYDTWNSFITEYNIDVDLASLPTPIRHYKLNGNVNDSSPNNDTATANSIGYSDGLLDQSAYFDHTLSAHIDDIDSLDLNPYTISVWVKWESYVGHTNYMTITGNGAQHRFLIHIPSEMILCQMDSNFFSTSGTVPENEWTHVVFWFDGSVFKYYFNGEFDVSKTSSNMDLTAFPAKIGTYETTPVNYKYKGFMDDFRIYDQALTDEQIRALYNEGLGTEEENINPIIHEYSFNVNDEANRTYEDLYKIQLKLNGDLKLIKRQTTSSSTYTDTTLAETNVSINTTASNYNHIKIIYATNKIEVYVDNKFALSHFDHDFVAGQHRIFCDDIAKVKDLSVKRYIPYVHTVATKEENYDIPLPISYINTSKGLLRHYSNTDEEIVTDVYPSRVFTDEVRVWDTMDNDFSLDFTPPMPLYWRRVYDPSHKFIGAMYVENGIYGILYSDTTVQHYVYDKPYQKGQIVDIDFKQNPNYEVWNDSYSGREHVSYNSGQSNWNEDGLEFEAVNGATAVNGDLVKSNKITQLYSTYGHVTSHRVDFKFKADGSAYLAGSGASIGDIANRTSSANNVPFTIRYYYSTKKLEIFTKTAVPTVASCAIVTDDNSFDYDIWYTCTAFFTQGGGVQLYVDGKLFAEQLVGSYTYNEAPNGTFDIGDSSSGTFTTLHFQGEIEYVKCRLIQEGLTVPKATTTPIIWHSFDERDWNNSSSLFVNKGNVSWDIGVTNNPQFTKLGRYNQALSIGDSDGNYIDHSNTTITGMNSGFTAQMWVKINTSFTSGNDYKHILCITTGTSDPLMRIWGRTTGQLTFNFRNSSGSNFYINYDVASQTSRGHDVDDGKWYHLAMVWDNDDTTMKAYVNGTLVGSDSSQSAIQDSFDRIRIGHENDVDMEFDELIIHKYPLKPNELGVFVTEAYDLGQTYSQAEFEQLSNGTWRRKDKGYKPNLEYQPYADYRSQSYNEIRLREIVTNTERNTEGNNIFVKSGKFGKAIAVDGSANGSGSMIIYDGEVSYVTPLHLDWSKPVTVQAYLKSEDVSNYSFVLYFNSNSIGSGGNTTRYLRYNLSQLDFYPSGGGVSYYTDTTNAYSLQDNQYYFVKIVSIPKDDYSGVVYLYVDNALYKTMTYYGAKFPTPNTSDIHLGASWVTSKFEISNLQVFQADLRNVTSDVFCDVSNEIPVRYGLLKTRKSGFTNLDIKQHKLVSITPHEVNVEVIDEQYNTKIDFRTESGSYFLHTKYQEDFGEGQGYDGIIYYFREPNEFRFALLFGDGDPRLYDMAINRASSYRARPTNNDGTIMLFDHRQSNMAFMAHQAREVYSTDYHVVHNGWGRINYLYTTGSSEHKYGYVPIRSVNRMFWNADQLEDITTYSNESQDWYRSATRNTSNNTIANLDEHLNRQYHEKGLYLVIVRGKVDSGGVGGLRIYNSTDSEYIYGVAGSAGTVITGTGNNYYYTLFNITADLEQDQVRFILATNTGNSAEVAIDYVMVIPITNGLNMPLDLIRQSQTKRFKTKVVE